MNLCHSCAGKGKVSVPCGQCAAKGASCCHGTGVITIMCPRCLGEGVL